MKMNKKGFTLAELLIVIAIIAILIAIAVPVFSGQLKNAQLQTDHANIHSAYAMVQVANLEGGIFLGDENGITANDDYDGPYYFNIDGSIGKDGTPYVLKTTAGANDCESSVGCKNGGHEAGNVIEITYDTAAGWTLNLVKAPADGV